jgi:hypothetical protein
MRRGKKDKQRIGDKEPWGGREAEREKDKREFQDGEAKKRKERRTDGETDRYTHEQPASQTTSTYLVRASLRAMTEQSSSSSLSSSADSRQRADEWYSLEMYLDASYLQEVRQ